jgi:hypothetical protein
MPLKVLLPVELLMFEFEARESDREAEIPNAMEADVASEALDLQGFLSPEPTDGPAALDDDRAKSGYLAYISRALWVQDGAPGARAARAAGSGSDARRCVEGMADVAPEAGVD